jgi:hypothetical protein
VYDKINQLKGEVLAEGVEEHERKKTYGKITFKLKPGLGEKGFFDTKAFG